MPLGPVFTQEGEGRVVKGAGLDPGHAERPEAGPQLFGRLPAERGDQRPVRLNGSLTDPASHPQGQHPRLAGTGASQDTQEGILRLNGRALSQGETTGTRQGLPGLTFECGYHILTVPKGCDGAAGPDGFTRVTRRFVGAGRKED